MSCRRCLDPDVRGMQEEEEEEGTRGEEEGKEGRRRI
jgi:hypothetical protein